MDENIGRCTPKRNEGFLVIYDFMFKELKLKGNALLVYARIYGFCKDGGIYYESRAATAAFLCISERSVIRAIAELCAKGLIEDISADACNLKMTRSYVLGKGRESKWGDKSSPDRMSSPDKVSFAADKPGDKSSCIQLTACHLINKEDNKSL